MPFKLVVWLYRSCQWENSNNIIEENEGMIKKYIHDIIGEFYHTEQTKSTLIGVKILVKLL